jgi:hypothetical protein
MTEPGAGIAEDSSVRQALDAKLISDAEFESIKAKIISEP